MNDVRTIPIKVSSRILRHMSRGIYRTPASALKELISNSYDAGANRVTLNTGWPRIEKIIITDDGLGMRADEFEKIVGQIGFSEKNIGERIRVKGANAWRTIIGHYGVGLLAVGQLASRMVITSKKSGDDYGFVAELDFNQFETVRDAGMISSKIKDEKQVEMSDKPTSPRAGGALKIGECKIRKISFKKSVPRTSFTKIELESIRKEVRHKLIGSYSEINPEAKKKQRYAATFDELLKILRINETHTPVGAYPYEKLIWEMGVYCPVPYPEPFDRQKDLKAISSAAKDFKFALNIDGIEIKKPFEKHFFDDPDYPVEHIFSWMEEPYTKKRGGPKASCYLIYKRRIRPKMLQGILVRESGVSIGTYDLTYLDYPFNEGMKFNQLTGEIYAEGLSGSLNIDRNSFNETDDFYLALSKWFHEKLNKYVFPKIKYIQKSAIAPKRKENIQLQIKTLQQISNNLGRELRVKSKGLGKHSPLISLKKDELLINIDHSDGSGSSAKREKVIFAATLVLQGILKPKQLDAALQLIDAVKKSGKA